MTWLQRYRVHHYVRNSIWILPSLAVVAQLSPRIIGIVFRDPVTKFSLTVFVFTFTFTLASFVRIRSSVPPLTAQAAAYGCLLNLAIFLYMIDHVGKALRPSGALWCVARLGREVIQEVYPRTDFVALAVTEIRQFGGASIQVARRLRAMLENLIQTLPEERRDVLRQELKLLHRSAERFFPEPEDRALADISDFQGVGGRYGQSHRQLMTRDSNSNRA
jgi:uncharacterized membrane protein